MSTIFSSTDIRGRLGDSLTPEYAWNVGKAFADWLPQDGHITIVAEAGAEPKIIHAIVEGVRLQGRAVLDGGQGDAQHLIKLAADKRPAGSILVSHDEAQNLEVVELYQENGVLVTSDNGLVDISQLVEAGNFVPATIKGELLSV